MGSRDWIEGLEERVLCSASGCTGPIADSLAATSADSTPSLRVTPLRATPSQPAPLAAAPVNDVVYVETNNPATGKNALLAQRRDSVSGKYTRVGLFATGGTGFYNADGRDSDTEIVASADSRVVYAVNQGSNDVTAFRVGKGGALARLGPAVRSGGVEPASLSLSPAGDFLYVANLGNTNVGGQVPASYSVLRVAADGSLSRVRGSTVVLPDGVSTAQVLASRNGGFVFGENFSPDASGALAAKQLQSFGVGPGGRLDAGAGSIAGAVGSSPILLGLTESVDQRLLYAGQVASGRLAVFRYDARGRLTFLRSVATEGASICWLVVSADGKFLYESSTGSDSIEVFSLADPENPVHLQNLVLADDAATSGRSHPFQIALDPSGRFLYAVNQSTTPAYPRGNALHVFRVGSNGLLTEAAPLAFPQDAVPAASHPQGVLVLQF